MNVQNIPRDDKAVKSAFVPKLDAFLFADYPNIELKLLAYYLDAIGHGDMATVFRTGADLHKRTAAGVFGVPENAVTDLQRQVGKKLNFSIVYGGGTVTLVAQGVAKDYKEAIEVLHTFHSTWPGIGWESKRRPADPGTLMDHIKRRTEERGYITTLWGRHLHPRSMHSALNALIQGCAADLMKWALVEVHDWLGNMSMRSHLVNVVHDELMIDAAEDELPLLRTCVPSLMTYAPVEAVVPIRPEPDISFTTWADKQPY